MLANPFKDTNEISWKDVGTRRAWKMPRELSEDILMALECGGRVQNRQDSCRVSEL